MSVRRKMSDEPVSNLGADKPMTPAEVKNLAKEAVQYGPYPMPGLKRGSDDDTTEGGDCG